MDYNQNIYDVFNYRKDSIYNYKSIDELLSESKDFNEYLDLSMIEFRSTSFMEDLVLEAMMFDDFNEDEIRPLLEEIQEKRDSGIKQKLHDAWEKLKGWIKSVAEAVRKFFESCRRAIRKAIDSLLGKKTSEEDKKSQEVEVIDKPKTDKKENTTKNQNSNVIDLSTTKEKESKSQSGDKALPGGGQLPPPQSEDDRLRERFRQSSLVVDIDDFADLEIGARKAIETISKLTHSNIYEGGREAILKAVGLKHPGGSYDLMRGYFMKSWDSKKVPVKNLDPVKIRNIINKSNDYAEFIQAIENKCILAFGRVINGPYPDSVNFGLSLLNSLTREAVHFLRLQIQVYTKIMTKVLSGKNEEENK